MLLSILIPANWFFLNFFFKLVIGVVKGHFIIGKVLVSEICIREKRPWSISLAFGFQALGYTYGYDIYSQYFNNATEVIFGAMNIAMAFVTNFEFEETLIEKRPLNRM